MPRYFFDVDDGERVTRDEVGQVLDNAEAAKRAAIASLPSIARDVLPDDDHHLFRADVRNEDGQILLEVTLELKTTWRS